MFLKFHCSSNYLYIEKYFVQLLMSDTISEGVQTNSYF